MPDKSSPILVFCDAIHLEIQGEISGPFSQAQVKEIVKQGLASKHDRISFDGKEGHWAAIETTSLKKYLPATREQIARTLDSLIVAKVPPHPPQPQPKHKKGTWLILAALLAGAALVGAGMLLSSGNHAQPTATENAAPPTAADFAGQTYDLMETRSAWSETRLLRLRLQPEKRIFIVDSSAPLNQLDNWYYRWSVENGKLVLWTQEDHPFERYPVGAAGQKELTCLPAPGSLKHRLVRVEK